MNWKYILLRLAGVAVLFVAGILLYAVTVNILILFGLMPDSLHGQGFGYALTSQTIYVAMGTILISVAGIFIRQKWRNVLYLAPLYAPSVFAIIFTLLHRA